MDPQYTCLEHNLLGLNLITAVTLAEIPDPERRYHGDDCNRPGCPTRRLCLYRFGSLVIAVTWLCTGLKVASLSLSVEGRLRSESTRLARQVAVPPHYTTGPSGGGRWRRWPVRHARLVTLMNTRFE